jgi:hypothetical protein
MHELARTTLSTSGNETLAAPTPKPFASPQTAPTKQHATTQHNTSSNYVRTLPVKTLQQHMPTDGQLVGAATILKPNRLPQRLSIIFLLVFAIYELY